MLRIGVLVVAAATATGCHGGPGRGGRATLPADCLPAGGPKVEVQRCDEEVVRLPPRKVVVDLPPECAVAAPRCESPAACAPKGAPRSAPAPEAAAPAPHTLASPMFAPAPFVGTPLSANVGLSASGAQVASARPARTRFAFAPTTIHIPFPWLKCVPVEEPEEMTVRFSGRSHAAAPAGAFHAFQSAPVMPMGFPMAGMPMGMAPAGGLMMAAPAGGMMMAAPAPQAQLVCPPCPPSISPERVQEFTRRIQELEGQLRANQGAAAPAPCPTAPAAPAAPVAPTMP